MTITLHVGAPKCGSSALQTALSIQPNMQRPDGTSVDYAAVTQKGEFLVGDAVQRRIGIFGYTSSAAAERLLNIDLDAFGRRLREHPADLVMSSESWLAGTREWSTILERIGVEVDVVVYVRPQVPVINSAWWQTGAWGDRSFDEWVKRRMVSARWTKSIDPWLRVPGVRSVAVRSASGDIVRDFLEGVLRVEYPLDETLRTNRSMPASVLRLFQRNPRLKPKKGRSRIDFILSTELKLDEPTLWVIDQPLAARIVEATRADNERLLTYMDEATAAAVRADPAWWDATHYAKRVAAPPERQPLDPDQVEKLCVALAEALVRVRRREAKRIRNWTAEEGDDVDDTWED